MRHYSKWIVFSLIIGLTVLSGCGGGGSTPDNGGNQRGDEGIGDIGSDTEGAYPSGAMIVDHHCTRLHSIPVEYITRAKTRLVIAYGHTSHGSQLVGGMRDLAQVLGSTYSINGGEGSLSLHDTPFDSTIALDLGNPNYSAWDQATRDYLGVPGSLKHPEVNVVIWSWCGEASNATESIIKTEYLDRMSKLETDYPMIHFVYMTGHLDGSGESGNLNQRNNQIREYCKANGKILYDFADIESYDPDGNKFVDKNATDGCNYVLNGQTRNWATEWERAHPNSYFGTDSSYQHTKAINGNMKAYAAWWLWARLAGWNGSVSH